MRPTLFTAVIILISIQAVALASAAPLARNQSFDSEANNKATNTRTIDRTDPVRMLKQTTDHVLQLAKAAQATADLDREAYYRQVEAIAKQVVDQTYFARGVMGTYASARRYQSLKSDQERQEFRYRLDRFTEELRRSFIVTYADALLSFDGERFELEPPPSLDAESKDIMINQKIISDPNVYLVQYRLRKNNDGNWLIANVIVEGLSMGLVYRNQFADAVERHRGDVDYVVRNWQKVMTKVAPEKSSQNNDSATIYSEFSYSEFSYSEAASSEYNYVGKNNLEKSNSISRWRSSES